LNFRIKSASFYLRLHPALLKEKTETEKQPKQRSEDISLEWRQYCLDPLCTNFNQVIQNMFINGSRTSPPNKLNTSEANSYRQPINSTATSSQLFNIQQEHLQQQQYNFYEGYSPMPLSPPSLFSHMNGASGKLQFLF
jgi:hypothetical protein